MLNLDDIKVEFESQGFRGTHLGISPEKDKTVLFFESIRSTKSVRCPTCGGSVYIYENGQVNLKDIPLWRGTTHTCNFFIHRYKCNCCQETFTEEIPFKYPGTRITYRAANWIKGFLQQKLSIKAIQELTGIHWDTIRKVQREIMDEAIWKRENELKKKGYKPRILAVDEFAIHKGHSYATCVMDLEQGDILWVGKGRAMKDFEKFFEDIPSDSLSAVIAVAMDMNASYNKLVTKHLPEAQIVYDRFHMQSQFGRDVLGVVRLDEARKHKAKAKEILADIPEDADKETLKSLKQEAKAEKQEYSQLKKLRWSLLTNGEKLSERKTEHLQSILQDHHNLAVCYAMKEEMCRLYELTDYQQSLDGWSKWFEAAKESNIPPLVKFAQQKEKRLLGLAAHAIYPISTGKLEGFNNKIKVAKRIGYGYRDDDFFFTLIRYLSIPSVRSSHKFP
jgi:transposase